MKATLTLFLFLSMMLFSGGVLGDPPDLTKNAAVQKASEIKDAAVKQADDAFQKKMEVLQADHDKAVAAANKAYVVQLRRAEAVARALKKNEEANAIKALADASEGGGNPAAAAPQGKWIRVLDTLESFKKLWTGNDSVAFDPDKHVVRATGMFRLGGFNFDAPWRQLSIKIRVEKLDGQDADFFDMHIGKYKLVLGPTFANRLPMEAQLDVSFDERKQQIYVLVNGKRAAEVTVLDDTWDKKLSCTFSCTLHGTIVIGDVRIRVE